MVSIVLLNLSGTQEKTNQEGNYSFHLCSHSLFQSSFAINYQAAGEKNPKENLSALEETPGVWKIFHFGHRSFYINHWPMLELFILFSHSFAFRKRLK